MSHLGQFSNEDSNSLMELMSTMYPGDFFKITPDTDAWQKRVALWQSQLKSRGVNGEDAYKAILYINANDENPKMPTIAKVVARAKLEKRARISSKGKSITRIETPEEVIYNTVYLPIRKKDIPTDEDIETLERICFSVRRYLKDIIPDDAKTDEHRNELVFLNERIVNKYEQNYTNR